MVPTVSTAQLPVPPAVPWYRTAACYAADENNGTENNRDDYALSCFRLRRDIHPRAKN